MNTVRYIVGHRDTTVVAGSQLFINHTQHFRIIQRSVAGHFTASGTLQTVS